MMMHNTKDCCRYTKDGMEKSNIHSAKKRHKGTQYSLKQSLAQLSKNLDKLEKAIKKQSAKGKKRHYSNSDSNLQLGIELGSIGKVEIKLGDTIRKTKFTPPSLIIATPNVIASNHSYVCWMSVSNAGDVMMMSSSQNKGLSTLTNKDAP
jgi:hypothetical protein